MGLMGEEEVRGRGEMVGGGVFFFFCLQRIGGGVGKRERALILILTFASLISVFFIKKKEA